MAPTGASSRLITDCFVCVLQGDLDRQRLLGNRQRVGMYEPGLDDNNEGFEHQER